MVCTLGYDMWAHGGQWIYIAVHAFCQVLFFWSLQGQLKNVKGYMEEEPDKTSNMLGLSDPQSKFDHIILGNWKDITKDSRGKVEDWGHL